MRLHALTVTAFGPFPGTEHVDFDALNDAGLWLNSSQVDMFAVPHEVSVQGGDGRTLRTGAVKAGGRQRVIDAIRKQPGFEKTVHTGPDGTVLRVLSPGKAADAGLFSATYLDPYIAKAWQAYAGKTLTVVPFGDRPDTRFFGRTSGNVMTIPGWSIISSDPLSRLRRIATCPGSTSLNDASPTTIRMSNAAPTSVSTLGRSLRNTAAMTSLRESARRGILPDRARIGHGAHGAVRCS